MNQQPPPAQKPITYFIVQPDQFQAVCNKISGLPYNEVAGLIQDFVGTSRAMFTPLPEAPGKPAPPLPNDPGAGQVTKPNGSGSDELGEGIVPITRPGWRALEAHEKHDPATDEYDASMDTWWRPDPDFLDGKQPGGAE